MNLLTFDAETFYGGDYTLKKMTTEQYVRHPDFETILVGVKWNDARAKWVEHEDFKTLVQYIDWSNTAVLCHNSAFDCLILSHHYGVRPAFIYDTLSMARPLHGAEVGGSLAKLVLHYGVGVKGDEVLKAEGKRREHFSHHELEAYGAYCVNDVELTYKLFQAMKPDFPQVELRLVNTTIKMFTEPKLVVDEPLLQQSLIDERAKKEDFLRKSGVEREILMSNDKFAALLKELGEDPPQKVSTAKSKKGALTWAFAKTDPGFQALLDHPRDEIRWLAEARLAVKSTLSETRTERFLEMGKGGRRLPVALKYYRAHTGRWSGIEGTNFQNLPRGSPLRKGLLAPDGYVLSVVDSAQIEARMLAWLAGHEVKLDLFRRGVDVYAAMGTRFYGRTIDRKIDVVEGQNSKNMELGLGYGMGFAKFAKETLKGMNGAKPLRFTEANAGPAKANVPIFLRDKWKLEKVREIPSRLSFEELAIHCAVADGFVQIYRQENAEIPAFWNEMTEVLHAMHDGVEMEFGPGGCLKTERHAILLPNGMRLKYRGLELKDGEFMYLGGRTGRIPTKTYGGSITENVTQALARIIVAGQMLKIEERYPIVTMSHDEVVFLVPVEEGPESVQFAKKIFATPPTWAPDLPLSSSGGFNRSYGLAKS